MEWTTTNLWIQIVGALIGAHIAATAAHEHAFGFWGHTVVGLIAGALGGYFLQTYAVTMVTGSGSLNAPRPPEVIALQAVTGAVLGGIAMIAVGFVATRRSPPGAQ